VNLPPVVTTEAELRAAVAQARAAGNVVGLVPTMGALHAGHAKLIEAARAECGFVIVTIFVNPTQFGPKEDFARYPRQLEADREVCAAAGADLIFAPPPALMYPEWFATYVEVHGLQDVLEGASRPGHFRGVATVVLKLFNLAQADVAFFGQKDAQQVRVIATMVRDLNVPVRVAVVPTVREPDGLALSSRNQYLDADQRRQAVVLHKALEAARSAAASGERDPARLERLMAETVATAPLARPDYARVVDADSLQPVAALDRPVLALLAVHFGGTRLIDNILIPG
jgi:pantoate--beta-alanine ligase